MLDKRRKTDDDSPAVSIESKLLLVIALLVPALGFGLKASCTEAPMSMKQFNVIWEYFAWVAGVIERSVRTADNSQRGDFHDCPFVMLAIEHVESEDVWEMSDSHLKLWLPIWWRFRPTS
jgi:hypothetical protein